MQFKQQDLASWVVMTVNIVSFLTAVTRFENEDLETDIKVHKYVRIKHSVSIFKLIEHIILSDAVSWNMFTYNISPIIQHITRYCHLKFV